MIFIQLTITILTVAVIIWATFNELKSLEGKTYTASWEKALYYAVPLSIILLIMLSAIGIIKFLTELIK